MSNQLEWAKKELELVGGKEDEMQKRINADILAVLETFSNQEHSNFSAQYVIRTITRLMDWKPITPLTGEDDEWCEPYDSKVNTTQQNKRCSSVFRKDYDNSTAYHIEGKIFSDDGGQTWFTNRKSFVPVTFPFHVPDEPEKVILSE